jgi:uncharacterized protein (DUF2141 family)
MRPATVWDTLAASVLLVWPALATDLVVEVRGVPSSTGRVLVAACAPNTPFPAGPCTHVVIADARAGAVALTLRNMPGGRFALSAFHDSDGDGQLGRNWLGLPTECIGFGNNAPVGRFGPPGFDAAAVTLPPTGRLDAILTLRCR